jgi:diacylglycerol kinase
MLTKNEKYKRICMKSLLMARIESFKYAWNGIKEFVAKEPNARIHLVATTILCGAIVYFKIRGIELLALITVTGFVWVAEAFNTAVEAIMDFISPEYHPRVGLIKDISAGAVLIAVFTALIIAAIVFFPKLF